MLELVKYIMNVKLPENARLWLRSGFDLGELLQKTTHLAVVAHQDDLEIGAFHGILQCYHQSDRCFGGVILTNGANPPKQGEYSGMSGEEMSLLRNKEQEKAAEIGNYGWVLQLNLSSGTLDDELGGRMGDWFKQWMSEMRVETLYSHHPLDQHPTHLASFRWLHRLIKGVAEYQDLNWFGVEVWGKLEWLPLRFRVNLDVTEGDGLAQKLIQVFESQLASKRYDLAELGLRQANATYAQSHQVDHICALSYAADLSAFLSSEMTVEEWVDSVLAEKRREIKKINHY
jgi:LmbE family N-acetylglucosaminyl deacetylase